MEQTLSIPDPKSIMILSSTERDDRTYKSEYTRAKSNIIQCIIRPWYDDEIKRGNGTDSDHKEIIKILQEEFTNAGWQCKLAHNWDAYGLVVFNPSKKFSWWERLWA